VAAASKVSQSSAAAPASRIFMFEISPSDGGPV
jgi:hypothetical protein